MVEAAGNKVYNPNVPQSVPSAHQEHQKHQAKENKEHKPGKAPEPEPDLEVKEEDKQYDTYPAEVKAAYNRAREEAIRRNKAADLEQKRRQGLIKEVVVEPDPKEMEDAKKEQEKKDKEEKEKQEKEEKEKEDKKK